MDKFTLGLAALFMVAMVAIMAPGVLMLNRGKVLRNIAIWLAIILALAIGYRVFVAGHPGLMPAALTNSDEPAPPSGSDKNNGDKGFTPPSE